MSPIEDTTEAFEDRKCSLKQVDNETGSGLRESASEHVTSTIYFSLYSPASVHVICFILPGSLFFIPSLLLPPFRYLASLLWDQYGLVLPVFSIKYLPLSS